MDGVEIQPVFFQVAAFEIFDQDIGFFQQAVDDGLTIRRGDVDGDRAFVAVAGEVIGTFGGVIAILILQEGWAPFAGVIADARAFDLDHVRAKIA